MVGMTGSPRHVVGAIGSDRAHELCVGDARVDVRGDRILYQAVVPRPGDEGCCPTGKAMVTFEPTRLRASAVPQGFQADYPPVKGRRLPEGGAKR
jgi:hypothetical protein